MHYPEGRSPRAVHLSPGQRPYVAPRLGSDRSGDIVASPIGWRKTVRDTRGGDFDALVAMPDPADPAAATCSEQTCGPMMGPMTTAPVNLTAALATFDEVYSPRIVARMSDYDVRVAHTKGEHVWHVHEDTDEFFLVLHGQFDVAVRDSAGNETTVVLRAGDTYVVPKGTEHKPSSPGGSVLMFEPSGTSTTGDRHDGAVPDHVDSTTGHDL